MKGSLSLAIAIVSELDGSFCREAVLDWRNSSGAGCSSELCCAVKLAVPLLPAPQSVAKKSKGRQIDKTLPL